MLSGNKDTDSIILNYLSDDDLYNVLIANNYYKNLSKFFWMNRILKKFSYLELDLVKKYKGIRSWSDYYVNDLSKTNANHDKFMESVVSRRLDHVIIALHTGIEDEVLYTGFNLACWFGCLNIVQYILNFHDNQIKKKLLNRSKNYIYKINSLVQQQSQNNNLSDISWGNHIEIVKLLESELVSSNVN